MLKTAVQAAKTAGQILKKNYDGQREISWKEGNTFVTETDLAAERKILALIKKHFPRHGIYSEEAGYTKVKSDYLWIIDPLDGTSNFSVHIHHFCVSIALLHKNKLLLGVVYDPLHEELFSAEAGRGAFLNEKKIRRTDGRELAKQMVGMCRGQGPLGRRRIAEIFSQLTPAIRTVRMLGATALGLCYVANNRLDSFINSDCNFYDCAAGCLVAQEAGLPIVNFKGRPWQLDGDKQTDILAADKKYLKSFVDLLKEV